MGACFLYDSDGLTRADQGRARLTQTHHLQPQLRDQLPNRHVFDRVRPLESPM